LTESSGHDFNAKVPWEALSAIINCVGKFFRFTWLILIAAGIYLGWTYYSRWRENRDFIQRLEERKESKDRFIMEAYGSGRLTIMGFYASPSIVHRGERSQLCYSVANSKSIRIEPPLKDVWPSLSRCIEISPQRDTVYRLIAEDAEGHTKTATAEVRVR
jgi:hypothetical protein